MKKAPPRARNARAFIDAVEDETARLMIGEHSFDLPTSLLPVGAREGDWIEISIARAKPGPDGGDIETRRRKLGRDDPGGDIKL
jgi:hypothetical protein